jgi:hypothetical protein
MSTATRPNYRIKNESTCTLHAAGFAGPVPKCPDVSRIVPTHSCSDKSECSLTHSRATFRAQSKTKLPPALYIPMTLRKFQNGAPRHLINMQSHHHINRQKIKEKHRTRNATIIIALKRILHIMMLVQTSDHCGM